MCSSSDIGVDRLGIFLDFVSHLVERFEDGFATVESEVSSLEKGVHIINVAVHGGWRC